MSDPTKPSPKTPKISLWGGVLLAVGGLVLLVVLWKVVATILKMGIVIAILAGLAFIAYWWFVGRKNDRPGPL